MQHFIFCVNYWISADRKDQIKVCSNLSDFTRSSEKFNCLLIFKCWKRLLWLHGSTSWNKYISKCVSKLCGYSCILRYTTLQSSFVETFFFFLFPEKSYLLEWKLYQCVAFFSLSSLGQFSQTHNKTAITAYNIKTSPLLIFWFLEHFWRCEKNYSEFLR